MSVKQLLRREEIKKYHGSSGTTLRLHDQKSTSHVSIVLKSIKRIEESPAVITIITDGGEVTLFKHINSLTTELY